MGGALGEGMKGREAEAPKEPPRQPRCSLCSAAPAPGAAPSRTQLPGTQPGLSKGEEIWPFIMGMNMKNAFIRVLCFFTGTSRSVCTFPILTPLWLFCGSSK